MSIVVISENADAFSATFLHLCNRARARSGNTSSTDQIDDSSYRNTFTSDATTGSRDEMTQEQKPQI